MFKITEGVLLFASLLIEMQVFRFGVRLRSLLVCRVKIPPVALTV